MPFGFGLPPQAVPPKIGPEGLIDRENNDIDKTRQDKTRQDNALLGVLYSPMKTFNQNEEKLFKREIKSYVVTKRYNYVLNMFFISCSFSLHRPSLTQKPVRSS